MRRNYAHFNVALIAITVTKQLIKYQIVFYVEKAERSMSRIGLQVKIILEKYSNKTQQKMDCFCVWTKMKTLANKL